MFYREIRSTLCLKIKMSYNLIDFIIVLFYLIGVSRCVMRLEVILNSIPLI